MADQDQPNHETADDEPRVADPIAPQTAPLTEVESPDLDAPFPEGPQRLDPNWVKVQRISGWIFAGIVSALGIAFLVVLWLLGWTDTLWRVIITLGVFAVIGGLVYSAHIYPVLWYRHASYTLAATTLQIRTGVWWKRIATVPRSRVQHTDVSQGPLMRKFRVAKLVVHTAGTQHATVEFAGLSTEMAHRVRDHLIARVAGDEPRSGNGGSTDGV